MRFEKPNILAFGISCLLGIIVFLLGIFQSYSSHMNVNWGNVAIGSVIFTVIGYILIRLAVEGFIYNKVKIIYKNIHDLKVGNKTDELVRSTNIDSVTKDVSEWAEQRQTEIEDLRARETFRREFIGNISHELKTPIFNIQGYLLTLLDGALDDPEINRKYLKRANKSVDRMINIIEDLETITNLEANRVHLNLTNFDLVSLVKDSFELLEDYATKNGILLKLGKDYDKPIKVNADRQKMEQVLMNLLVNAIKYSKDDGKVEVKFFDMHNNILVEVADDGLGIPQSDIPRIFERFYRVDKSRSRDAGGTGLGLSIVKHIMEAHKQTINVRSSENDGSTFSFTLKKSR